MKGEKLFTDEEEQFIRDNAKTMSRIEIAKAIGRGITPIQVRCWISHNGLSCRQQAPKTVFTEEAKVFMQENYKSMKYKDIAKELGYTERQVRGYINNHCGKKLRNVNDDYFNSIDEPLKAYFLGLLYADGWVIVNPQRRTYEMGIELQYGDKYIIDKLNEVLGNEFKVTYKKPYKHEINGKITESHGTYKLRVYSKQIVSRLVDNGVVPRKTQSAIYPVVDEKLFFDFLRGYIDGDGCFWKYKNHYYLHITSANNAILKHIQERLLKYDIETRIYKERDHKYRLMCVNLSSMEKLVKRLYPSDDVFCLRRKIEKVKSYLIGSAV